MQSDTRLFSMASPNMTSSARMLKLHSGDQDTILPCSCLHPAYDTVSERGLADSSDEKPYISKLT